MNDNVTKQILDTMHCINVKLSNLEKLVDNIETRLDNLETRLDNLEKLVDQVNNIETRLTSLENTVTKMEYEHGTKLDLLLDYAKFNIEKHNFYDISIEKINSKLLDHDIQLESLSEHFKKAL